MTQQWTQFAHTDIIYKLVRANSIITLQRQICERYQVKVGRVSIEGTYKIIDMPEKSGSTGNPNEDIGYIVKAGPTGNQGSDSGWKKCKSGWFSKSRQ